MGQKIAVGAVLLALVWSSGARATDVAVCTDAGRFVIELADEQAPLQVQNFLRYVDMGYYAGTVFHRVVKGFVVQGGGFDRKLEGRATLPPVANESSNGLSNRRTTVAAARTANDPDSATAQFFVNLEDNADLDTSGALTGYTVFGRVKDGMSAVDRIGALPTGAAGPLKADVPMPLIAITSIVRLDETALDTLPKEGRSAELVRRMREATENEHFADALQAVELYRAICGAPDPQVVLLEAKAALALGRPQRARYVLDEYFAVNAPNAPDYAAAQALLKQTEPQAEAAVAQQVDDCAAPKPPGPIDGSTASEVEMLAGQKKVREFVAAGEAYIACVDRVADDKDRKTADRNAAIGEHNRIVGLMDQAAADFNAQIRIFKSHQH